MDTSHPISPVSPVSPVLPVSPISPMICVLLTLTLKSLARSGVVFQGETEALISGEKALTEAFQVETKNRLINMCIFPGLGWAKELWSSKGSSIENCPLLIGFEDIACTS